jgi:hypothetical protein
MRRTIACLIFAATAGLHANVGWADMCRGPSAPAGFPDPANATEQDILAAQQSVKHYLSEMESTLKCMDATNETYAHDIAVGDMEKIAAKFNSVLRAFRARQKT